MTLYETLFVVHPERGSRTKEFIERFKKVIEGQAGTMSLVDEWGVRDLAYRIEKQSKGYYVLLRYNATGRAVEELERNLKLTDGILRYLTVRTEESAITNPNPAAVRSHSEPPRHAPEADGTKAEPSTST
ncbi:MAG TPA: 30S ribosomal protein S6 [Candidatus Binatia bacterium]